MSDTPPGNWRLFLPADLVFVYELVAELDPRWWRLSRHGLEPARMLALIRAAAAGVVVVDGGGKPVACALLAETGTVGTGLFEYFALPNPEAETVARHFASDLITAAFGGAPVRRLYYERFENDADVLGEVGELFEREVTFPDFAMIDGRYEARVTLSLSRERFAEWKLNAT